MKLVAVFSLFAFIGPKFAKSLKKIVQSYDCKIAAFRNSGLKLHTTDT